MTVASLFSASFRRDAETRNGVAWRATRAARTPATASAMACSRPATASTSSRVRPTLAFSKAAAAFRAALQTSPLAIFSPQSEASSGLGVARTMNAA